jgi:hypothetical protein
MSDRGNPTGQRDLVCGAAAVAGGSKLASLLLIAQTLKVKVVERFKGIED